MNITTYLLGSLYIMMSIFRFSDNITTYLFDNNIINLPLSKFDKINESIYSSIHSGLVTLLSSNCLLEGNDNNLQVLTVSICLSYFFIDLYFDNKRVN